MKKSEKILVRRYAQAFLNLFSDQFTREHIEQLPELAQKLDHIPYSLLSMQHSLGNDSSNKGLEKIFKKVGFKNVFTPLVSVLTLHGRLILLPHIIRYIYKEFLERHDIMDFTIESAVELTDEERNSLVEYLHGKTGKDIRYTLKINRSLIAGVKMYSNTLGFEHSVQQKLQQIYPE